MECKFKSTLSGRDVAPSQYLAEIMCLRQAKKKGIRLADKFWNEPVWRMPYKTQLIAAHKLLKVYSPQAIINAVSRKEIYWVYSLHYKGLIQFILEEEDKLKCKMDKLEKIQPMLIVDNTNTKPQSPFSKTKRTNLDE